MSVILRAQKILFIHVPKTAGASFIKKLSEIGDPKQVITNKTKGNHHAPYYDCQQHIEQNLNDDINDWYKFTVVRNPWNRVTSWYYYRKNFLEKYDDYVPKANKNWAYNMDRRLIQDELDCMNEDFNKWFLYYHRKPWDQTWFSLNHSQSYWHGDCEFDDIIRFENLDEDMKKISIFNDNEMNHNVHRTANSESDWRSLYNKDTIDLVATIYKEDIEKFGYRFDK